MKLMIFAGTTEGHDLCRFLSKNNVPEKIISFIRRDTPSA